MDQQHTDMDIGGGKKVLCVDDDPTVLAVVKKILSRIGFKVITARNGQEGLAQVKKHDPQVIIADVLMPVMDGFVFFEKIKENKSTQHKPVLILTARQNLEDSFMKSGADGFLIKPIDSQVLINTVIELSKRSG